MNRDTLKTIGAIVLIAIIVVATFLYGNQQRQAQLRHDQEVKQQQQKKTETASNSTSTTQTAEPDTSNNGTAPVQKPTSNSIQAPEASATVTGNVGGGTLPTPTTTPSTGSTGTQPTPTTTPDTGGELSFALPLAAIIGMLVWARRERELVAEALRAK